MIVLKIDVTKIEKDHLFVGQKGKFLDAALHDKPNDYGDDGFITQSVSKEKRAAGVKGPIIGNWRHVGAKPKQATNRTTPTNSAAPTSPPNGGPPIEDSEIPF